MFIPCYQYLTARGFLLSCVISLSLLLTTVLYSYYNIFFFNKQYSISFLSQTSWAHSIDLSLSFELNALGVTFSTLVILIGLTTNIYTLNYFKNEAQESIFLFWLNAFIISMLTLVLSNNFFTLFLGWELIGLTSFFLINFWTAKRSTLKSSFKAFTFNGVSDVCLLIALINFFLISETNNITLLTAVGVEFNAINSKFIYTGSLFLIICASIKSVQLLGHLWLPDSMEAPVPASSLIHSATLVSAGVFILLRFQALWTLSGLGWIILGLGSITAAYGGVVAAAQTDMKKLLAYSTMSHCGFLYVCIYLNNFYVVVLYLFLHGVFKAATFYCAGTFIRVFKSQDTRLMGGGQRILYLDAVLLVLCAGNLGGLPFFVGYYYKALFLTFLSVSNVNSFSLGFIIIGLLSSVVYTFRILYYSCFDFIKVSTFRIIVAVQNTRVNVLTKHTLSTPSAYTASLILLIASFIISLLMYYLLTYAAINIDSLPLETEVSTKLINTEATMYTQYVILFYFFYLVITMLMIVVTYRYYFLFSELIFTYITGLVCITVIVFFL